MRLSACDSRCVMTFVRAPVAGRVKTRLMNRFSAAETVRIYRAMVADVMEALNQSGYRVRVHVTPDSALEAVGDWLGPRYRYFPQSGGGLGSRMAAAFSLAFAEGWSGAVLVGTDIPELSAQMVHAAFAALEKASAVLAPAEDGGYCLIGFRRGGWLPAVFSEALAWGTPTVLADTVAVLQRHGVSHHLLPVVSDIDTPADLAALIRRCRIEGDRARHTVCAVRAMMPSEWR